jgi:alkanesulfonate monooxygenase SsuD/methylene tetrahydromethanopterin reductase-like flavin-dependent oxidoreductase (luciferase family)
MIRLGVALLPEVEPHRDDRWRRAEQYGFAHAWTFDHLAWRSLADSPWYATVPVLTAAALTTSTMPIGTLVASPNFRHPVPFSKELMTLDVVSGGRLLVAMGSGGLGFDASVLGTPELTARDRHQRFEEFVVLLDLLLRQRRTSWRGNWYSAVEARTVPGPVQSPRPPLLVAANGPKGIRLALTRADGWVTFGTAAGRDAGPESWWQGVASSVRRFEEAAHALGGPPDGFRRVLEMLDGAGPTSSVEKVKDDVGRAYELGFTDAVIAWPRHSEPYAGSENLMARLGDELSSDGTLAS